MNKLLKYIVVTALLTISLQGIHARSLALDSVAAWGRFPRFCVDTYRWGDRFFNSYDTAYVEGTGYKFNIKAKTETWTDNYIFQLPDGYRMRFASEMNTSSGLWLTYLAVSMGYDVNLSKYFGGSETLRKRFQFRFNCALFAADLYWITNDVGTRLTSYGSSENRVSCDIPFDGINTNIFGIDAYYFFNNKRYSRAAAFNYSKLQKQSQGSWFAGLSYWTQDFEFNFTRLPDHVRVDIPEMWGGNDVFHIKNRNYSLRGGYGYNWVFHPHWLLGVSESPSIGFKYGTVNGENPRLSVSLYNRFQTSVVWNNKRWFAGAVFSLENGLYFDRRQSLVNGMLNAELTAGYRFNLW